MTLKNWIRSAITGMALERPAQKMTLAELAEKLAASGAEIREQAARAPDTAENRAQLAHIIGVERWGQRRLRVALGDPLLVDESDHYLPPADDWAALCEEFGAARAETIALVRELDGVDDIAGIMIPHNQYGKLSVFGWLHYLDVHSNLESKAIG